MSHFNLKGWIRIMVTCYFDSGFQALEVFIYLFLLHNIASYMWIWVLGISVWWWEGWFVWMVFIGMLVKAFSFSHFCQLNLKLCYHYGWLYCWLVSSLSSLVILLMLSRGGFIYFSYFTWSYFPQVIYFWSMYCINIKFVQMLESLFGSCLHRLPCSQISWLWRGRSYKSWWRQRRCRRGSSKRKMETRGFLIYAFISGLFFLCTFFSLSSLMHSGEVNYVSLLLSLFLKIILAGGQNRV